MAKRASTLNLHRPFEAKIHLRESWLPMVSPFPAFIEVETNPLYKEGKFKKRRYSGFLGSQGSRYGF